MEANMHNIEHESSQNDSAVKITELPTGEKLQAHPFQSSTMTKRLKPTRSRPSLFAGGTLFLMLLLILTGVLSSCSQAPNSTSHAGSVSVPTSIPGTPPPLRSIPAPKAKPINSPVWSDHNVSVTTADGVAYAG